MNQPNNGELPESLIPDTTPPDPDVVDDEVAGQMLLAQMTGKWMAIVVRLDETDPYTPIVWRKTSDFPRAMIPSVIETITADLQKQVPGPPVVELAEAKLAPLNRLDDLGLGE